MDSENNINNNDVIDLRVIVRNLWKKRKSVCITMLITAVVASALILMVPRAYDCEVSLAPEDDRLIFCILQFKICYLRYCRT